MEYISALRVTNILPSICNVKLTRSRVKLTAMGGDLKQYDTVGRQGKNFIWLCNFISGSF